MPAPRLSSRKPASPSGRTLSRWGAAGRFGLLLAGRRRVAVFTLQGPGTEPLCVGVEGGGGEGLWRVTGVRLCRVTRVTAGRLCDPFVSPAYAVIGIVTYYGSV